MNWYVRHAWRPKNLLNARCESRSDKALPSSVDPKSGARLSNMDDRLVSFTALMKFRFDPSNYGQGRGQTMS